MRTRGKTDGNHTAIVLALRQAGATVQSLATIGNGCPDLVVGYQGRNVLLEVKDEIQPPSKRKLTPLEVTWHDNWRGQVVVVESVEQALIAVVGIG